MPDHDVNQRAGENSTQFGSVSGGHISISNVAARIGPWGCTAVAVGTVVTALAAIVIVSIFVVGVGQDGTSAAPSSPNANSSAPVLSEATTSGPVPTLAPATDAVQVSESLPQDTGCPLRASAVWLQVPNVTYGPFFYSGLDYYISFDAGWIYATNGLAAGPTQYPDPGTTGQRNQWITLAGNEPVIVCVDTAGNVYADFG